LTANCGPSEKDQTMRKDKWTGFVAGGLLVTGVNMARQDLMGLDKYIELMKLTWVHMSPWWSLIPVALGVTLLLMPDEKGPRE